MAAERTQRRVPSLFAVVIVRQLSQEGQLDTNGEGRLQVDSVDSVD
jgi:hypothetical protein